MKYFRNHDDPNKAIYFEEYGDFWRCCNMQSGAIYLQPRSAINPTKYREAKESNQTDFNKALEFCKKKLGI